MCKSDDLESVDIDLDDADTMALIEEMRNAETSEEAKRKIDSHKIYLSERKRRIAYNRRWRSENKEHCKAYDAEYHSRPEVKERKNEQHRLRYHEDVEHMEKKKADRRARYYAMTPEQHEEYNRKQAERQRKRRARERDEREKREANNARVRAIQAAWTPEQRAEYNRKQRERRHAQKAMKATKDE